MRIADTPEPEGVPRSTFTYSGGSGGEWHVIRPHLRASKLLLSVLIVGYIWKRVFSQIRFRVLIKLQSKNLDV
jgi:hypothetical protein